MLNHSSHPWTPRCYRPVKTHAITNIIKPNIESSPILLALLEMSKGLPPPDPASGCDAGLDVVDDVLVAMEPFLELDVDVEVVVDDGGEPPTPPSADDSNVEDVAVVSEELDVAVTETAELVRLVVTMDCGGGTEVDLVVEVVLKPSPPVFPALFVGMVTETAGATVLAATGVVDDFRTVV